MKTFQDFQKAVSEGRVKDFLVDAINQHRDSEMYITAVDADEYLAQRNTTITRYRHYLYTMSGQKVVDYTSQNSRLASNFFHRLITQRRMYSLGNGISFANAKEEIVNGRRTIIDTTKDKLGNDFDTAVDLAGDYAIAHGLSFLFWNYDHADVFKITEFVPLWDEETGVMRAGIRFWSLEWGKRPIVVVLYEEDGYTKYQTVKDGKNLNDLVVVEEKRSYKEKVATSEADGEIILEGSNYSSLPIKPFWGSKTKQSALIGMKGKIDAFDLIDSGFCDDLQECAEVYWLIENAMGETDESLMKFRDRLKFNKIAAVDTMNSKVTPYTQDVPTESRSKFLAEIRNQIYEDFGALDVHTVAAGATNDHIDAAYQPMDEEADDFEYQVIVCIRQILQLIGIDDTPVFKRNRISNQKEQTEMVMLAANYLDDETVLKKLPFITVDEVESILEKKLSTNAETFTTEE